MSLWDRVSRRPRVIGSPSRRATKALMLPFGNLGEYENQVSAQNYAAWVKDGFKRNGLIYSAIMYKVRAQRLTPLRGATGDYDRPEWLPPEDPLSQLLTRPNPNESWPRFMGKSLAYFNLSGNAYIYIDRQDGSADAPGALYSFRPDRMFPVPREIEGQPPTEMLGYLYVPEGSAPRDGIPFLPEDVIHVSNIDPLDPYEGLGRGMSQIEPLAYSADVDNMATEFLRDFFGTGGMPMGLLTYEEDLHPYDVDEIHEMWREYYGGYTRWAEPLVLGKGATYTKLALTFEEMGFATLDERNESRILMPFGVPAMLLGTRYGLDRSTFSNFEEARRHFWVDTFLPELTMFELEFRAKLQAESPDRFVAFDVSSVDVLQENVTEQIDGYVKLVNTGVPKRIAAETVGLRLPDLPDGDVIYLPTSLTSLADREATREQMAELAAQGAQALQGGQQEESGAEEAASRRPFRGRGPQTRADQAAQQAQRRAQAGLPTGLARGDR